MPKRRAYEIVPSSEPYIHCTPPVAAASSGVWIAYPFSFFRWSQARPWIEKAKLPPITTANEDTHQL